MLTTDQPDSFGGGHIGHAGQDPESAQDSGAESTGWQASSDAVARGCGHCCQPGTSLLLGSDVLVVKFHGVCACVCVCVCVCVRVIVQGPFHIAQLFLGIPKAQQSHLHRRLIVCFKEFTRRSAKLQYHMSQRERGGRVDR